MIIIAEPDKIIRKKLSDLLRKERIIGIDMVADMLEKLCKFREEIDVIIINIRLLNLSFLNETVPKLCQKLNMSQPPLLCYYKAGDENSEILAKAKKVNFLKFDETDPKFPSQYVKLLKGLYPNLNADLTDVKKAWVKVDVDQDLADVQEWLEQEGLVEKKEEKVKIKTEEKIPSIEKLLIEEPEKDEDVEASSMDDYKAKYFKLKKKYDELYKYVKELIDFTKG